MATKLLTLCIVHQGSQVLLGMKKRGFGVGRWNGFGGKVHDGETIETASLREVKEESGITPLDQVELGVLNFTFDASDETLVVHIFKCTDFTDEVGESEEMRPQWFSVDTIPFEAMWKDDIFWFPLFLQNKKFEGKFHFNTNDEIVTHELKEVG